MRPPSWLLGLLLAACDGAVPADSPDAPPPPPPLVDGSLLPDATVAAADAAGADAIVPSVVPECPPGEGDGIAIEGATPGKNHVRRVSWVAQPTEVRTFGADEVLIIFTDPVDEISAETPAHYQIDPPVAINSATRSTVTNLVVLKVAPLEKDVSYQLSGEVLGEDGLPKVVNHGFQRQPFVVRATGGGPSVPTRRVQLNFSQSVACTALSNPAQYQIPGYTVVSVSFFASCTTRAQSAQLVLDRALASGPHTLTVGAGIVDLEGAPPVATSVAFEGPGAPAPFWVTQALTSGATKLALVFNEHVGGAAASSYTVTPELAVSAASVLYFTANLTTAAMTPNQVYTVQPPASLAPTPIPPISFWGHGSFLVTTAFLASATQVEIRWSEPIGPEALDPASYSVSGGVSVKGVTGSNHYTWLEVEGVEPGIEYTVTIDGAKSLAGVPAATGYSGLVELALSAPADPAKPPAVWLGAEKVTANHSSWLSDDGKTLFVGTGVRPPGKLTLKVCGLVDAAGTSSVNADVEVEIP